MADTSFSVDFSSDFGYAAALSATQASQGVSAGAKSEFRGTLSVTTPQTLSGAGQVPVSAHATVTQSANTISAAVSGSGTASLTATQTNQTVAGFIGLIIVGAVGDE